MAGGQAYEFVGLSVDNAGVAVMTLNRPERLNAWHEPMREEVRACFNALNERDDVRAIVLTGAGDRAFCAGQDLAETQKFESADHGRDWLLAWRRFYGDVRALDKPTVAAVNGVAAGSGFQIAALMDIRVGHPGIRMGQTEINSGIVSTVGPWILTERLGISRATALTLTGRLMNGQECLESGLVQYLVPEDQVMPTALKLARELAAKPPNAMRLTKRYFRELTEAGFRSAFDAGERFQPDAFASGEPQKFMAQFFAERAQRKRSS